MVSRERSSRLSIAPTAYRVPSPDSWRQAETGVSLNVPRRAEAALALTRHCCWIRFQARVTRPLRGNIKSTAAGVLAVQKGVQFGLDAALGELPRSGKPRQLPGDAIE